MSREFDFFIGIIFGAVFVAVIFMSISTYNGELLDRGLAEYNVKTGDLELKECEDETEKSNDKDVESTHGCR